MLLHIPEVFSKDEVARLRAILDAGPWADGNATSGHLSARAKNNAQLPEDSAAAREVGAIIEQALAANPMFVSAALPHTVFPPLFNRYEGGQAFAAHVDNAIRTHPSGLRIRSDLSATLFLSEPTDYDGGELTIETAYGPQTVKLPGRRPGPLSLAQPSPCDRRDPRCPRLELLLDPEPRRLGSGPRDPVPARRRDPAVAVDKGPSSQAVLELTGVYHNLLRRFSQV